MQSRDVLRALSATILLFVLTACAPPSDGGSTSAPATAATRTSSQQRLGDENHTKILNQFGGAYKNARVTRYVNGLGRELAQVSEQPNQKWTFTVLDSPTVNAFALPGGYVYVTRGLLALANSEAEVAGVIGHEIGHVTAGHSSLRQNRASIAQGALIGAQILGVLAGIDPSLMQVGSQLGQAAAGGFLANYSRDDELAADNLGIRYLARAGYDPYAQADFLESLGSWSELEARAAGKSYNRDATGFFASHPANGPRTRRAIQIAQSSGLDVPVGAARNRNAYLQAIDGIGFGQSPDQGLVEGESFIHPKLRFTYTAPNGFRLNNTPSAVIAEGPNGARFVMDGTRDTGVALDNYIARTWVNQISRDVQVERLQQLRTRAINDLPAASAYLPVRINNRDFDAHLTVVRMGGTIYRMTGLAPRGSGRLAAMERAASSFRRLSSSEANGYRAKKIDIVRVRAGDTIERLARRMNVEKLPVQRFRVLNGLQPGQRLRAGDRVKIIR